MYVKITYPQIVFESKLVQVTKEQFLVIENMCIDEKAAFIWSKMTDDEQNWSQGEKAIESALEEGYIKIVKHKEDF